MEDNELMKNSGQINSDKENGEQNLTDVQYEEIKDSELTNNGMNQNTNKNKKIIFLVVCVILSVMGIFAQLWTEKMVGSTEGLFMFGKMDPIKLVTISSYLWVVGVSLLPIAVFGIFKSFKDKGWVYIIILAFLAFFGCFYIMIQSQIKIKNGVDHYDYYSDGVHSIVISNSNSLDETNIQGIYIRVGKNCYQFVAGGTTEAEIKWEDDGVHIWEYGKDLKMYDYSNFYIE